MPQVSCLSCNVREDVLNGDLYIYTNYCAKELAEEKGVVSVLFSVSDF